VCDALPCLADLETKKHEFMWGVATAAYQIEGATGTDTGTGTGTAAGGRGASIWDEFVKLPHRVAHGDTADVADLSYYKYEEDIALMKSLGVKVSLTSVNYCNMSVNYQIFELANTVIFLISYYVCYSDGCDGWQHYRFSISWSRIFPKGKGEINPEGVLHYNDLINSLVANGINPVVTLYHWDLPQSLEEEYKGWLDSRIVNDFVAYAETCFALYGDRVKMWITLNEVNRITLNVPCTCKNF
jgi:beta-glucosidase/6-phospho-beta-glucosidase/beta-galactosidase